MSPLFTSCLVRFSGSSYESSLCNSEVEYFTALSTKNGLALALAFALLNVASGQ